MNSYTKRLKEYIGPTEEGRSDFFDLTPEESIKMIKEKLKENFSCNLWTYEWSNEEINIADKELTEAGIIHVYDELMNCINCFKSEEDMKTFYLKLRVEATEEQLNFLKENKYNTPVINWYEY